MQFSLKKVPAFNESFQTHWKVRALVIENQNQKSSPALEALEQWSKKEKADFNKILKAMKRVAQTTHVQDPKHVKRSTDPKHENVYEMRAHRGNARLMFFYSEKDQTAVVVCTNSFWKGKANQNTAFETCDQLRRAYEAQI